MEGTKAKMARKSQKIRKTATGEWIYVSFTAHPEELERYRKIAQSGDRSLSWWLRKVANQAVEAEAKEREGFSNETKPERETKDANLEGVSTHRA